MNNGTCLEQVNTGKTDNVAAICGHGLNRTDPPSAHQEACLSLSHLSHPVVPRSRRIVYNQASPSLGAADLGLETHERSSPQLVTERLAVRVYAV